MNRVYRNAVRAGVRGTCCALLCGALATPVANAQPADVTDAEFALLPQYCRAVQGYKQRFHANSDPWVEAMGPGFEHMHHYCWALVFAARAEKASVSASQKKGLRSEAVANMQYVIRNTTPEFIMLPEIYSKIGQLKLQLGEPMKAKEAFEHSIALKPDYWPPYFYWTEYLRNNGQLAAARTMVDEGLKHSPGAKPLLEQQKLLEGASARAPAAQSAPPQ
jgi:hypothetical protein